jgi:hypothetical protein
MLPTLEEIKHEICNEKIVWNERVPLIFINEANTNINTNIVNGFYRPSEVLVNELYWKMLKRFQYIFVKNIDDVDDINDIILFGAIPVYSASS